MSTECCTPADALLSPSGGGRELCVRKYVRTYVRYIRTYVREITAPPSPDDLRLAGRLVHEDMGTVHLHDDVLLLQSLVLPPPPPPPAACSQPNPKLLLLRHRNEGTRRRHLPPVGRWSLRSVRRRFVHVSLPTLRTVPTYVGYKHASTYAPSGWTDGHLLRREP